MFQDAHSSDCPKMLPGTIKNFFLEVIKINFFVIFLGSGKRRLKNIKAKPESSWTDVERKFVALVTYITEKRAKYFEDNKNATGPGALASV